MSSNSLKRPRIKSALSDRQIRNAKLTDKEYSLSDGNGLSLLIDKNV